MGRYKSEKFAEFKRRTILDAATAVFSAKGLEKATMRAIAAEAGVTTGAVYTMFSGKEEIYAELLRESLARLHAHVSARAGAANSPRERMRAAVTAFFDYYTDRLFEVQLGMHSFAGIKHSSLGRERDAELNAALIATLDVIAGAIRQAAPELSQDQVRAERDAIFASLIGTLVLAHTGRAESVGTTPAAIMRAHVDALLDRV